MPAYALSKAGNVSLDEIDPPTLPTDQWVRIEPLLSGICGSDISAVTAHDSFTLEPFGAYPFTFGHENVGVISEIGARVKKWQVGDRVVVNPMISCVQRGFELCAACARGDYGLCRRTTDGPIRGPLIGFSPTAGGGWSQSFVARETQLHAAGNLSDEVAVLTDPFASALRPVLLHAPSADDTVLVLGAGTIGALVVAALRITGFGGTINVLARYPFQAELAERLGATRILRTREELYKWAGNEPGAKSYKPTLAPRFVEGGPSLVFDTIGTESSLNDALALTREAGRIVLIGAAARATTDWTRLWYRQISIAGVFVYGSVPYHGSDRDIYEVALELIPKDLALVTHTFPLKDYQAALSTALHKQENRTTKVAFRP